MPPYFLSGVLSSELVKFNFHFTVSVFYFQMDTPNYISSSAYLAIGVSLVGPVVQALWLLLLHMSCNVMTTMKEMKELVKSRLKVQESWMSYAKIFLEALSRRIGKTTTRETQCAATQFWKWCPEALYLTHPEPTKICYLQIMLFLTQLYMCEDSVSYWIWTSHSSSYVDDTISHILVSHDKSKNKYNGERKTISH